MFRKISYILILTFVIGMLPIGTAPVEATASGDGVYLIADFEDGIIENVDGGTYSIVDGPGAAKCAVQVPVGSNVPLFNFGLRSRGEFPENSTGTVISKWKYDTSVWIKANAPVEQDIVEFVFTLENAEYNPNDNGILYSRRPKTVTETVLVDNANLVVGEWVKVSTTITYDGTTTGKYKASANASEVDYDYKTNPVGTVGVRVGGGVSYAMDDLQIVPQKYIPRQSEENNPVLPKPYASVTNFTADTYWGYSANECDSIEKNTAADGTVVKINNTETKVVTNPVTLTNNDYRGELTCKKTNIKYGVEYVVSFMAKAENESAKKADLRLFIMNFGRTDKENVLFDFKEISPSVAEPKNSEYGTYLSDEWRYYYTTFKLDYVTYDESRHNISFRLSSHGDSTLNLNDAKWSIASINIDPSPTSENTNLRLESSLTAETFENGTSYNVVDRSDVKSGEVKDIISRVLIPYKNDYVIAKTFVRNSNNWNSERSFVYSGNDDIARAKISSIAKDKDDYFSEECISDIKCTKTMDIVATAEIDQTVWAPDMPKLTATVRYNNAAANDELMALCAMYSNDNKLISCNAIPVPLTNGIGKEKLEIATTKDAMHAKVFLWQTNTAVPVKKDVIELTKTVSGKFVYVDSVNGKDNSVYGFSNPLQNMTQAFKAVENIRKTTECDIYVILMDGDHLVQEELKITPNMTHKDFRTTFVSFDKNDKAVLTGGTDISGKFTYFENGIYRAEVSKDMQSRQMFVDGVRATTARSRELEYDEFLNTTTRPSASSQFETLGDLVTSSEEWSFLADCKNPSDLEFVFFTYWTMSRCQVESIVENDDGTLNFKMDNPGWLYLNRKYNTYPRSPVYIENAYELLDEPGEWYMGMADDGKKYVYYMPRQNEDIDSAKVVVPTLDNYTEKMLYIIGTETESVSNVTFDGVEFAYTTWTRPSTNLGHADGQNNYLDDRGGDNGEYYTNCYRLPHNAIDIDCAKNIDFYNCTFTKLGINGIRIFWNVQDCDIVGNEFYDISGSAINVGDVFSGEFGWRTDLARGANIKNINISNNYIHHVAKDYWSAAAVGVSWAKNTTISHNEICSIPYTAIHVGYGWEAAANESITDLTVDITDNYIHDLFKGYIYDGGAIYTNGLSGGTKNDMNVIRGNYIEDMGPGGSAIYNDEGSTNYLVENNVVDLSTAWGEYDRSIIDASTGEGRWLEPCKVQFIHITSDARKHELIWRNNYANTDTHYVTARAKNDSSNHIDYPIVNKFANWCDDAIEIINNAGLEEEYRDNFRFGLRKILVPEDITLTKGNTHPISYSLRTEKNTIYNSNLECVISSGDETVAKITDNRIQAVGVGSAVITYSVVENGILYKSQTTVTVSE